jgi:hypothetical protein
VERAEIFGLGKFLAVDELLRGADDFAVFHHEVDFAE